MIFHKITNGKVFTYSEGSLSWAEGINAGPCRAFHDWSEQHVYLHL